MATKSSVEMPGRRSTIRPLKTATLKDSSSKCECLIKNLVETDMSTVTESALRTRRSLLSRLRALDDRESWRTFFDL